MNQNAMLPFVIINKIMCAGAVTCKIRVHAGGLISAPPPLHQCQSTVVVKALATVIIVSLSPLPLCLPANNRFWRRKTQRIIKNIFLSEEIFDCFFTDLRQQEVG